MMSNNFLNKYFINYENLQKTTRDPKKSKWI